MADVKLSVEELALFNETGSRGDYYRAAVRDKAADQVDQTGRMSEITSETGRMADVVMPATPMPTNKAVDEVVPPTDLEPVAGPAPGTDTAPKKGDVPPPGQVC